MGVGRVAGLSGGLEVEVEVWLKVSAQRWSEQVYWWRLMSQS